MDKQIGKVIHYYDKIGVAVIAVMNKALHVGDEIRISGHDKEFTQTVDSLEVEHKQVKMLAKGKEGAMKVSQPVKEGDVLYLKST